MKLTYIGHACFLVQSQAGLRILLDPYQPYAFGGRMGLKPFYEKVDIVVSTHQHHDHFHVDEAFGNPVVVTTPATAMGIEFRGIKLPHDHSEGAERGFVTGFWFTVDGVTIFHPGDLGRPLNGEERALLGHLDVVLVPCGGTFTMGPKEAAFMVSDMKPPIAIPMHYAWPSVDLPLLPLDDFLNEVPKYEIIENQPFEIKEIPTTPQIYVLYPQH